MKIQRKYRFPSPVNDPQATLNTMSDLISFLESRLFETLPGKEAQLRMAPKPVSSGPRRPMQPHEDASLSSVLILLFPNTEQEWELILTLRTSNIDHGGQISLPGGRAENGETVAETALREANEEIGVDSGAVSVIGELSELFVPHSATRVTPVVGHLPARPSFVANPDEVEEIFAIELDSLLAKNNLIEEEWNLREHSYHVPYWDLHRVPLWGATAMILSEFLDLYREFKATES